MLRSSRIPEDGSDDPSARSAPSSPIRRIVQWRGSRRERRRSTAGSESSLAHSGFNCNGGPHGVPGGGGARRAEGRLGARGSPVRSPLSRGGTPASTQSSSSGEVDEEHTDPSDQEHPEDIEVTDKHSLMRFISAVYVEIAWVIVRMPRLVIFASLLGAAVLSSGLSGVTFLADTEKVYIPQHTDYAGFRREMERYFGVRPQAGMLLAQVPPRPGDGVGLGESAGDGGGDIAPADASVVGPAVLPGIGPQGGVGEDQGHGDALALDSYGNVLEVDALAELLDLYEAIEALTVEFDESPDMRPEFVSFGSLCARRYAVRAGGEVCMRLSVLQLWEYNVDTLIMDWDPAQTVTDAYRRGEVMLGGAKWSADGSVLESATATQLHIFFDPALPAFGDRRLARWEEALVQLLRDWEGSPVPVEGGDGVDGGGDGWDGGGAGAAPVRRLRVSYWSTKLNERDAQSAVVQDAPAIAAMFVAITAYVCAALSGFSLSLRRQRILLGCSCAFTTAIALTSGFGLATTIGIPIIAPDPLLCFTLIGVAVDDMIIIVDAFDRAGAAATTTHEQLAIALGEAGPAIMLTSLTTMCALISGLCIDMPCIRLFCVPAALALLMVNVYQTTLFASFLFLHAESRKVHWLKAAHVVIAPGAHNGGVRGKQGSLGPPAAALSRAASFATVAVPSRAPNYTPARPPVRNFLPGRLKRVLVRTHSSVRQQQVERALSRSNTVGSASFAAAAAEANQAQELVVPLPRGLSTVDDLDEDGGGCSRSQAAVFWRERIVFLLLHPFVRVVMLAAFVAAVTLSVMSVHKMEVGLPISATLTPMSMAYAFWADTETHFAGAQTFTAVLVVRGTESDRRQPLLRAAIADIEAEACVVSLLPNWLDGFERWQACLRRGAYDPARVPPPPPAPAAQQSVKLLDDGTGEIAGGAAPVRVEQVGSDNSTLVGRSSAVANFSANFMTTSTATFARAASSTTTSDANITGASNGTSTATGTANANTNGTDTADVVGSPADDVTRAEHADMPEPPVDVVALNDYLADKGAHACATSGAGHYDPNCYDDDDAFRLVSGGHVCAEAVNNCADGAKGASTVQMYCRVTCALCVPKTAPPSPPPPPPSPAPPPGRAPAPPPPAEVAEPEVVEGGVGFAQDVVFDDNWGHNPSAVGRAPVVMHRLAFIVEMPSDMRADYAQVKIFEKILDKHGVNGFVYHYRYEFGAGDATLPRLVLTNLCLASATIALCCSLFLPVRTALLCAGAVVCIDVMLLGAMVLWKVRLHCMTAITLLISLGLAIDYSSHLCHAYIHAPMHGAFPKVVHALSTMGLSILNAGSSTLIGAAFMGLSVTPVFHVFFIVLVHTVGFGLVVALMVMPALFLLGDQLYRGVFGFSPEDGSDGVPESRDGRDIGLDHNQSDSASRAASSDRFAQHNLGQRTHTLL